MLPASDPRREAERLRTIIVTLAETMPDMPMRTASEVIFESEKKSAELDRIALPQPMYVPLPDTSPKTGAKFIDGVPHIQQPIIEGKKINGIKEFRTLTGWGLREAKEAVEEWDRQRGGITSPPVSSSHATTGTWTASQIADWIDGQTKIIDMITGAGTPTGSFSAGKIHAIKEVRATCPSHPGLKEAKEGVEHWQRTRPL